MSQPNFARRVADATHLQSQQSYDVLYLENLASIRWLTGFAGSVASAQIGSNGVELFVDSRYEEYANDLPAIQSGVAQLSIVRGGATADVVVQRVSNKAVGVEPSLAAASYVQLKESCRQVEIVKSHCVTTLRRVKDSYEISLTKQAVAIAEQAFLETLSAKCIGESERSFRRSLDAQMLRLGAEGFGFDTMVLSGKNAAQPHGQPSKKRIEKSELIIVDWGAQLDGYRSDTSRTVFQGRLSKEAQLLFEAITEIVEVVTSKIIPGTTYGEVMQAAYSVLARYDHEGTTLADYIAHPFGHNVGLEIHEYPFFSLNETREILEGELVAFEPAIYVPDVGGVRIENMVHATKNGAEVLNTLPNGIEIRA